MWKNINLIDIKFIENIVIQFFRANIPLQLKKNVMKNSSIELKDEFTMLILLKEPDEYLKR